MQKVEKCFVTFYNQDLALCAKSPLIVLCDDCHNLLHSLYVDMLEYLATEQNFLTDTGEFRVGKHKGRRVRDVATYDRSYLAWVYSETKSSSDRKQLARYLDPFDI